MLVPKIKIFFPMLLEFKEQEYKFLLIDQPVFIARVQAPIKCFYSRMSIVHAWCDKMNFVKNMMFFLHVLKQAM